MAMLDTTCLIDLARRPSAPSHIAVARCLRALLSSGEQLFTSRINEAELRVGPERAIDRETQLRHVDQILSGFVILEFDKQCARAYGRIKAQRLDSGRPIGDCDLLIAAVAISNNQPLVTRNIKHFADIPGLVTSTY